MAYRRRQGITRASTFKEDCHYPPKEERNSIPISNSNSNSNSNSSSSSSSPSSSLAAQAIRASAAHRDSSSISSAYAGSAFHSSFNDRSREPTYEYTSIRSPNEPKGFWGVLAEKAKAILEDNDATQQLETQNKTTPEMLTTSTGDHFYQSFPSTESNRKINNPRLQKGLDAFTSSLNHIGDTIGNAFEEARTSVENKTADIIQETRKLQIRRRGNGSEDQIPENGTQNPWQQPPAKPTQRQMQTNQETQLKASRDVAMATAAKAKLLLRELKTVKADMAFAKERCAQLEEENKILREAREKGCNPADDDMIRLQLETLLAEKARLAHENAVYARENRFLMEIVEFHQLTMQDVVYLDEGIEEFTEVYPVAAVSRTLSVSPPSGLSPRSSFEIPPPKFKEASHSPRKSHTEASSSSGSPANIPHKEKPLTTRSSFSSLQDILRQSKTSS